jgi:hypothetical protein
MSKYLSPVAGYVFAAKDETDGTYNFFFFTHKTGNIMISRFLKDNSAADYTFVPASIGLTAAKANMTTYKYKNISEWGF